MEELYKIDFSFKKLFLPLTTVKASIIFFITGFIVFGNMLSNGFVWDDLTFILFNPGVHSLNLINLFGTNLFNDVVFYRPIPAVYFAVLYTLFSNNAFPYHILQLLLHIGSTILLYVLLTGFFKKNLSLFLAMIFLVHPIQVESVSYIAQTVSPLFFIFGISALLIFINRTSVRSLIFVHLLLLLAILTKETGVLFLILLNFYNLFYRKLNRVKLVFAGIITLFIYFAIRFGIGHVFFTKSMLISPIARASLYERILTIPNIIFYYIKTFFYPAKLSILQDWVITAPDIAGFYFPLVIDIAFLIFIIGLGIYCKQYAKHFFYKYLFFSFWFMFGMLFHLQIAPLDMTVAERWFYLPIAGLLGLIAVFLEIIKVFNRKIKISVYIFAVILLVVLSVRTMERNTNWFDEITLFTHDIKIHSNFDLENNLAAPTGDRRRHVKAMRHAKKSIEFFPYEMNYYNLALSYDLSGDVENAKKNYYNALNAPSFIGKSHKHTYIIYERLGLLLLRFDNPATTKKLLKTALTDYPEGWYLWVLLAISEYNSQNQKDALAAAEKAKYLSPNMQTNYVYEQIQSKQKIDMSEGDYPPTPPN